MARDQSWPASAQTQSASRGPRTHAAIGCYRRHIAGDEVITPYTNAFLPAAPDVTNITLNNQCRLDLTDHLEIAYDPVALADTLNALDPARPVHVPAWSCYLQPD